MSKYLTLEERIKISDLLNAGFSIAEIANAINRSRATIYYELNKHGAPGQYDPVLAHKESQETQRKFKGRTPILKKDTELCDRIQKLLSCGYSPASICDILKKTESYCITPTTIYRAIREGEIPGITMESLRPNVIKMSGHGSLTIPKHIRAKYGFSDTSRFELSVSKAGELTYKPVVPDEC